MTARMNANLVAATATGAGQWIALADSLCKHALQVVLGGTVPATTAIVSLEGSLDGATPFQLAQWTKASQASGDIIFAIDKPVPFLRANLTSLSGGTAPTVTAYIASQN